jgi:DNA-binding winged helix-turn-helix (wHTH) protein
VRVPRRPIQILLVAAAGEVVTRDALRDAIWAQHTHVDFDPSINKAINRRRQVLGDRSPRPRFIETVPRRGYRLVAPVARGSACARDQLRDSRNPAEARHFSGKQTVQALARSVDYFRQTIEPRSRVRGCLAGLAETYVVLGIFGLKPPHDAFPAARSAAERALALDGSSAQAHTVLADVKKLYEWDWSGAEHAYRRAMDIDPHSVLAHHWYAQLLAMQARHAEAFA